MSAVAESRQTPAALDQTQGGGPTPSDLEVEQIDKMEQRLAGPLLAEDRAALRQEVHERRLRLQEEDDRETAAALYKYRHQLSPDKVLMEQRVVVGIPAETVQEVRDMVDLHHRTRSWNKDEADSAETASLSIGGGVSGRASTTHFPNTPQETPPTPGVFTKKDLIARDMNAARRAQAFARANTRAAQADQHALETEVDAAFDQITQESGVRVAPKKKDLPAPSTVKLPSGDPTQWR